MLKVITDEYEFLVLGYEELGHDKESAKRLADKEFESYLEAKREADKVNRNDLVNNGSNRDFTVWDYWAGAIIE